MPTPSVLAIDGILVVTLRDDPTFSDDKDLLVLVGDAVVANTAGGLLIDLSILSLIDSYVAKTLSDLINMARLLGCSAVVAGMRPEVALTMVELGIELPDIVAAISVNVGFADLRRSVGVRV